VNITVDADKCCGAGQCVLIAPEVFDQNEDDGIVILLDPSPAAAHHTAVREAASVCPGAAITLDERP
jgi:ferredoxin